MDVIDRLAVALVAAAVVAAWFSSRPAHEPDHCAEARELVAECREVVSACAAAVRECVEVLGVEP